MSQKTSIPSLGINVAVGMVVFTLLGYWVDQKRGGGWGATIIGIIFGLFFCAYEFWKVIREQK
jgi:hypothetical protein